MAHAAEHSLIEYTGTLLHGAEARMRMFDGHSHPLPVLCLDIALDNAHHNHMHVEQLFPATHYQQAVAAAHRLKKGTHVTVQTQLLDLQLIARNAAHIHVIHQPQEQAAA